MVIVSHNLAALPKLCSSAIHLEAGRVIEMGSAEEVLRRYAGEDPGPVGAAEVTVVDLGEMHLDVERIESAGRFVATCRVALDGPIVDGRLLLRALDIDGNVVGEYPCPSETAQLDRPGELLITARVNWFPLIAGRYRIDAVVEDEGETVASASKHLEVYGDSGSRSARALLAEVRDLAISSQVHWTVDAA
ncbi:MAG: hypothetical protein U0P45_17040 [Acidimicrobiales bacterium]